MNIAFIFMAFLMTFASLFALILTLQGYGWAIAKFERLLYKSDYPVRLDDKAAKRFLQDR
jgi:hypothetical protein